MRHKAGVISAVDLCQQEALIEFAKADYANAVKNREQARNALATLINQPLPDIIENLFKEIKQEDSQSLCFQAWHLFYSAPIPRMA